ncbi:hypothetical protein N2152v2_002554 [Parachlorella kessleri]
MASPLLHYGLPPLPSLPCPEMKGPTPWSNWVIRGRILAGAYPASLDDFETDHILTTLLELGVNTFVCLQAEFALHTPETSWRTGHGLRPYIKDAQRLLIRARETQSTRIKQDKLDFLHLPIIDGSVTSDTALSRLADDCNMRVLRGERLYIHCWGGHGRTGTLVATMLGRLYSLSCSNALRYTQAFHDSRKYPQGVRSPQTQPQVAQVRRLLPDPPSLRGVSYPQPTTPLTDEIVRPSSTPPSPKTVVVGAEHKQQPINQQRKEAIRAKQSQAAAQALLSPTMGGRAEDSSLAEAMLRASLADATGSNAVGAGLGRGATTPSTPNTPSGKAVTPQKGAELPLRPATAGDAQDRGSRGTAQPRPLTGSVTAASAADATQRQAGYLQQFMQQRQMPQAGQNGGGATGKASPLIPAVAPSAGSAGNIHAVTASKLGAKLGSAGSGGNVVNMTASSGAAAMVGRAAVPYTDQDEEGGVSEQLRPSKIMVTVPNTPNMAKVEPAVSSSTGSRSDSRIGSVMSFINSRYESPDAW